MFIFLKAQYFHFNHLSTYVTNKNKFPVQFNNSCYMKYRIKQELTSEHDLYGVIILANDLERFDLQRLIQHVLIYFQPL